MDDTTKLSQRQSDQTGRHFDVLIAGAGISGVGAAYHLKDQCPGKSFAVLEELETFGGTWHTHKYPGIRSDSDLYTFGYRFKPWLGKPIATADEILKYVGEVIRENNIDDHIHFRHKIVGANWSSKDKVWTVDVLDLEAGETKQFTANFMWMCQGYYNHAKGYTPKWEGMDTYEGDIVHPQTWPKDLPLKGKNVIVIGSGATAATVVPSIAGECKHVTLLQRSPTYFIPGRNANDLVEQLRELEVEESWIHEIARRKILKEQGDLAQKAIDEPEAVKAELLAGVREFLGEKFDIDKHFTPSYRPWQQRIAFVPDGDLFQGIAAGKASVVTDHIDRFTPKGILLKSGEELEADIIITATGFDLSVLGGIPFQVDDKPVDFADTVTYRGMMFTGVPNMAWVFGYFRASWTLRVDLMGDFICRLFSHMDDKGAKEVRVELSQADADMPRSPWIEDSNFNPGYLARSMHLMPKCGTKPEWRHTQDYWLERTELPLVDLDEEAFHYD